MDVGLLPQLFKSIVVSATLISILAALTNAIDPFRTERIQTMDLIKSRGFGVELYKIESVGFPLTVYRIINPLANPATLNKYPVLYGHGIAFDSSTMIGRSENSKPRVPIIGQPNINYGNWIDKSDDNSLPFMFSNNNFDVWMFDARGASANDSSYINAQFNFKMAQKLWDFSLDDQALIDLPKIIDFVLMKTTSTKLVYVGYSESTFFMFSLLSTAPEYANKIAAFIAMAPVAYISHLKGLTVPVFTFITSVVPKSIQYSGLPQPLLKMIDSFVNSICKDRAISNLFCRIYIDSIGGTGSGERKSEFYTDFFKNTSLKALRHVMQLYFGKRCGMFDYGQQENLRRYNQPIPPAYNLSRIRSDSIILVRGLTDFMSTPEDQKRLISEIETRPYLDIVIPNYSHFDFIDGKDLIRLVNGPVMRAVYELLYRDGPNLLKSIA